VAAQLMDVYNNLTERRWLPLDKAAATGRA
jgi:hypothetical protein